MDRVCCSECKDPGFMTMMCPPERHCTIFHHLPIQTPKCLERSIVTETLLTAVTDQPPGLRGFVSPLNTGLVKKNGICSESVSARTNLVGRPYSAPVYVGENFAVRTDHWYKIARLLHDTEQGGLLATQFQPLKDLGTMQLTPGGYKIWSVPNAGGSSVVSEVLSFELFGRCFSAVLRKTEMEVSYFPYGGSITDYVCEMFKVTVGVSVTRAMKYKGDFTHDDATHLLNKKLKGVLQSSQNSLFKWTKQILHVWSTSTAVTQVLTEAYHQLDPSIKANTVVMVTTASAAEYIFSNG